jgi:two-component system competent response regulator ComA
MKQLLLVDDHPTITEGTKVILEQEGDITVTIAHSGMEALEQLKNQAYDVLLIDFNMTSLHGFDLLKEVFNLNPNAVILIYTDYNIEPHFNFLVEAGISGFVLKTASKEQLVRAIRCALHGETVIPTALFRGLRRAAADKEENSVARGALNVSITNKEFVILKYLAQGKSNREIAELLVTSQRTLEYSLTHLFQKLQVKSRREAVTKAKQIGLLRREDFF